MTNGDKIRSMNDEKLASWLCYQFWEDFDTNDVINVVRYNQVRNYLKMEAKEENANE